METLRRLRLPARHDQLAQFAAAANDAAREAGLDELQACNVELAVDEACANIVDHAYSGRAGGTIEMEIGHEPGRKLVVTLLDDGRPFTVPETPDRPDPQTVEEAQVGGLGLKIMRKAMTRVEWEFGLGGPDGRRLNRLTMTRDLRPATEG